MHEPGSEYGNALGLSDLGVTEKMTILSVGMPVYNGEPFISEAIKSLLSQSFSDFRLVISDNASIDNTEEICRDYESRDKRVSYIKQERNMGGAYNFRFVVEQSQDPFFMWAAADDRWDPLWLETLLPIAIRYNCMAFGTIQQIDDLSSHMVHPANSLSYQFAGHKNLRRIKYIMMDPIKGKANPIYSIMPRELLNEEVLRTLISPFDNCDNIFLYNLLGTTEIRCDSSVKMYKRITNQEFTKATAIKDDSKIITERSIRLFSTERVFSSLRGIKNDARNRYMIFIHVHNEVQEIILVHLLTWLYILRKISHSAIRLMIIRGNK